MYILVFVAPKTVYDGVRGTKNSIWWCTWHPKIVFGYI